MDGDVCQGTSHELDCLSVRCSSSWCKRLFLSGWMVRRRSSSVSAVLTLVTTTSYRIIVPPHTPTAGAEAGAEHRYRKLVAQSARSLETRSSCSSRRYSDKGGAHGAYDCQLGVRGSGADIQVLPRTRPSPRSVPWDGRSARLAPASLGRVLRIALLWLSRWRGDGPVYSPDRLGARSRAPALPRSPTLPHPIPSSLPELMRLTVLDGTTYAQIPLVDARVRPFRFISPVDQNAGWDGNEGQWGGGARLSGLFDSARPVLGWVFGDVKREARILEDFEDEAVMHMGPNNSRRDDVKLEGYGRNGGYPGVVQRVGTRLCSPNGLGRQSLRYAAWAFNCFWFTSIQRGTSSTWARKDWQSRCKAG
ncbi:hypothetical protein DFP72DRAFT_1114638 [Ephemerocybe angulata]|uniref:Uncharacterized protein n=1 Tax=Ephemerocybe angulata TaxID=980116 RepID=A0A8H6MAG5_9AGAR|nr:hypothetical protein DFP72DRAFT_1114638 [Tulosesus angulatus]